MLVAFFTDLLTSPFSSKWHTLQSRMAQGIPTTMQISNFPQFSSQWVILLVVVGFGLISR